MLIISPAPVIITLGHSITPGGHAQPTIHYCISSGTCRYCWTSLDSAAQWSQCWKGTAGRSTFRYCSMWSRMRRRGPGGIFTSCKALCRGQGGGKVCFTENTKLGTACQTAMGAWNG
jgi:hypothetical protein